MNTQIQYKNIPSELSRFLRLDINYKYRSMEGLISVLMGRSAWFKFTYEYIDSQRLKEMCSELGISYSPNIPKTHIFAMGYAHTVFFVSGIEAFLQNLYHNSVALHFLFNRDKKIDQKIPSKLMAKIQESKKLKKLFKKFKAINSTEEGSLCFKKILLSIGMSDIDKMVPFFDEIYGKGCMDKALTKKTRMELSAITQLLANERNGILHRGGEFDSPKDPDKGYMIDFEENKLKERYMDLNKVSFILKDFLLWTENWWLQNLINSQPQN